MLEAIFEDTLEFENISNSVDEDLFKLLHDNNNYITGLFQIYLHQADQNIPNINYQSISFSMSRMMTRSWLSS